MNIRDNCKFSRVITGGAALLVLLYTWSYLSNIALPGNQPSFPLGWWGWYDQGQIIQSTRALAAIDLDPAHHWYPLGYALLGAPFVILRAHPFFFVDLVSLLAAYGGFVAFARRVEVAPAGSALLFIGAVATDSANLAQWVIPWSSTPVAATLWLLFAQVAAWSRGSARPVRVGLLAAAVPLLRPTDGPEAVLAVGFVLMHLLRTRTLKASLLARMGLGGALLLGPYGLLHLAIYGPHPNDYMAHSAELGTTFHDLGWKAYVVLADPRAWFWDGEGLLRRSPWMALGLIGLLPALRRPLTALLALALAIHLLIHLSYVDLLPTGLWRYNNIHYWKWTMPGYGLLAWMLVRDLAQRRPAAYCALAAGVALAMVRITPTPARLDEPAKMLDWTAPPPPFDRTYFGSSILRDGRGEQRNVTDFRILPIPTGMRLLALKRDIEGPVTWLEGATPTLTMGAPMGASTGAPRRYRERIGFGVPCWLGLTHCRPQDDSTTLPPSGY